LAGQLILAAGGNSAAGGIECRMKTAPEITVRASGMDVVIDHSKSIAELNMFRPALLTPSPYGKGVETHIEGLMHGRIGLTGGYMFSTETYPERGKVCLYVSKVDVNFAVDPKIYIAREYRPGTCHYNAVLEHEKKHVRVDRDIVNKYTKIIVRGVNSALKQVGYAHGPYDSAQLPALQKRISGIIESVIQQYAANMNAEREALQKKVDTIEEYRRVDAQCPDKSR
jgi:hypothetical protein